MAVRNQFQYLRAGNAQLTTLTGPALANAEASLLAVSPFTAAQAGGQAPPSYVRTLPYFTIGPGDEPQLIIPPPAPDPPPDPIAGAVPQVLAADPPADPPADPAADPLTVAQAEALFPNVAPAFVASLADASGEVSDSNVGYLYRLQANYTGINPLGVDLMSGLNDQTIGANIVAGALTSWPTTTTTVPAGTSCPAGYEPESEYLTQAQQLEEQIQSATGATVTTTAVEGTACTVAAAVAGQIPLTTDDVIEIDCTSISTFDVTLTITARTLGCDGTISKSQVTLDLPAPEAGEQGQWGTVYITLPVGWLIGLAIYTPAFLQAADVYINSYIITPGQDGDPIFPLFSGYLAGGMIIGWPGAQTVQAGTGPGSNYNMPATGLGNIPLSITVPNLAQATLNYVSAYASNSNGSQPSYPALALGGLAAAPFVGVPAEGIPANGSALITWAPNVPEIDDGQAPLDTANIAMQIPIPANIQLGNSGNTITLTQVGAGGGIEYNESECFGNITAWAMPFGYGS